MKLVKLPKNLNVFLKVKSTPYEEFYKYVAKKLKIELTGMSVTDFKVSKKVDEALKKLVKKWVKENTPYRAHSLERVVSMEYLQNSPSVVENLETNMVEVNV